MLLLFLKPNSDPSRLCCHFILHNKVRREHHETDECQWKRNLPLFVWAFTAWGMAGSFPCFNAALLNPIKPCDLDWIRLYSLWMQSGSFRWPLKFALKLIEMNIVRRFRSSHVYFSGWYKLLVNFVSVSTSMLLNCQCKPVKANTLTITCIQNPSHKDFVALPWQPKHKS